MSIKSYFKQTLEWLFLRDGNRKSFDVRLLLGLLLIVILALKLGSSLDLPLVNDELYHVNDDVVSGRFSSINPYDIDYKFLGHPPGYRVSLLLWFKLFPGTHSFARLFSSLLTMSSLILVFMIAFRFSSWISSFAVPIFFLFSHAYLKLGNSVSGNMHEFLLILICFFLYLNKKIKWMSFFFLLLVMSRESGLSFALAFFLMELDRTRELKKVIISCLKWLGPGLFFFTIFAIVNYFDKGNVIAHPYANGGLAHLPQNYGLFTFNSYKLKIFLGLFRSLSSYMGGRLTLYIAGGAQVALAALLILSHRLKNWKNLYAKLEKSDLRKIIIFTLSINIAYFSFYSLYGDFILRDLIPCLLLIPLSLYLLIYLITPTLYFGPVCMILIISFFLKRGFLVPQNRYANSLLELKAEAREMERKFNGLTVCYPWPFRLAHDKVHGLFSEPIRARFSCKEAHVWPIFRLQSKEMGEKVEGMIRKHDMKLVHSYKGVGWGFSAQLYQSKDLIKYK